MVDKILTMIALSESNKTGYGKGQEFSTQSAPQKVFTAIWYLEMEVNNGGFWQYLANSSAETAPFVQQALKAIGANYTADLCKKAFAAAFRSGLPKTAEAISSEAERRTDELTDILDPFDQQFFEKPDDLTELLYDYVAKHPQEFGELPQD